MFATLVTVLGLAAPSAHAIPRTFVSGTGSGATCTRAAPCATFQAAHDATDANGEINCVDAGEFGRVTITKSITIDCAGTAGVIADSAFGISINTAGVVVRVRNLTIDGSNGAFNGITFATGAALIVENCVIANHTTSTPGGSGIGIKFDPPAGVTAKLLVSNTLFSNNHVGTSGGGMRITVGPGSARAVLSGLRLENNAVGIQVQSVAGSGGGLAAVQVRDSVAADNSTGVLAVTGGPGAATLSVTVDRSSSLLNASNGVHAQGPSSFVLVGRSTVISNGTGLKADGGGQIFSYQNNHGTGNVTDGAPTAFLTVK
jgi:hypothetical protein